MGFDFGGLIQLDPDENDYDTYLQSHGGFGNAHTDAEETCFAFDIDAPFLPDALDRMAQFFIGPLMKEDRYTEPQQPTQIQ